MSSVSRIVDLDGDGVDDYAIAAPIAGASGIIEIRSGTNGHIIHRIVGGNPGQSHLGWSLADAGDFDGDGVHDVVAGAPGDDSAGDERGRVDVYCGSTGALIASYCCGTGDWNQIGTTVAGIGDVDGDGYDDVMAGGRANYALVLGGPDCHLIRIHSGAPYWSTVASLGDVNLDGTPDYVIGWPQSSINGQWTGTVRVYSGADGSTLYQVHGDQPYDGDHEGDSLGWSVAAIGDLNADGVIDFAAGGPGGFGTLYAEGPGYVRIYSGTTGELLDEIWGDEFNSTLGIALGAGGDINADGVRDWIGGAPGETATISGQGAANVYSAASQIELWKLLGDKTAHEYGQWLTILDDLDGDGYDEFAVGDKRASHTAFFSGRVTIYRGGPGDAVRFCPATANSSGVPARIDIDGPISISYARMSLVATDGPADQFGLFFYAANESEVPFGNGVLCAGAPHYRLGPPQLLDNAGTTTRAIDFTSPPVGSGSGQWTPGSTWILQFWYRDPMGGGSFFNLSDALRLVPTP